jgi:hypothetical protein
MFGMALQIALNQPYSGRFVLGQEHQSTEKLALNFIGFEGACAGLKGEIPDLSDDPREALANVAEENVFGFAIAAATFASPCGFHFQGQEANQTRGGGQDDRAFAQPGIGLEALKGRAQEGGEGIAC